MIRITATQAARDFPGILSRVRHAGQAFIVEKNGEPVCCIKPAHRPPQVTVNEFMAFLAGAPWPDEGYADDVELIQRGQPKLPRSPRDR